MIIFKPHPGPIYSVAFLPNGDFLVTSSVDETVKITDLKRSEEVRKLPGSKFWCPIALTRDGKFLARGGYGVVAWNWSDSDSTPIISDAKAFAASVAFSPNGQVLSAQGSDHPLRRWAMPSGQDLPGGWGGSRESNNSKQFPSDCVAYSSDGTLLGTSFGVLAGNRYDSVILLWNADSGSLHSELQTTGLKMAHPTAIAFSPNGSLLAGVYGPALLLFDVPARKLIATVKPGLKHFKGLAFTPDGRRLATVNNDRIARIWQVPTLSEVLGYEWRIGKLTAIGVAPDGLRLAAGSDSGKVVVWDLDG